jgi:1,2-diacylglycerol 3-alpha-glucosyltransferase
MMNPKEIRTVQFIDDFFPVTDGVVQTVHNYATVMNRETFAAVVAPRYKETFDDSTLPYSVYRTKQLPLPLKEFVLAIPQTDRELKTFLERAKPHLLHAHSPFAEGRFAADYARKMGIPCVSTFHSKYYDDILQITGSKAMAKAAVKSIVNFYNSVDSVWTCSNGTAETLRSYGYNGEIFVIDNGSSLWLTDTEKEKMAERAADQFSLPGDKKIILFVGQLIWQKNLRLVLDTFRLLCDKSDEYCLLIVGGGYHEEEIKRYAQSLHFGENVVRFTGKISDRNLLAGVYCCADLFFFPSIYDNSPLVVREAAAMGLPALLAEGSNAAEAVQKDISGFTASADKAAMLQEITRIFETPDLINRVAARAQRTIPKSWDAIVKQAQEKYAEIINRSCCLKP